MNKYRHNKGLVKEERKSFPKESKEVLPFWQMPDFANWLDRKLSERDGWNDARLAKEAGINQSVLSKGRGGTGPGLEACLSIARALRVPVTEVLVAAGHIPKPPEWTPEIEEVALLYDQLSEDDKDDIRDFMRRRAKRRERSKERSR
jgi:hypothetical protein